MCAKGGFRTVTAGPLGGPRPRRRTPRRTRRTSRTAGGGPTARPPSPSGSRPERPPPDTTHCKRHGDTVGRQTHPSAGVRSCPWQTSLYGRSHPPGGHGQSASLGRPNEGGLGATQTGSAPRTCPPRPRMCRPARRSSGTAARASLTPTHPEGVQLRRRLWLGWVDRDRAAGWPAGPSSGVLMAATCPTGR